jgi:hypothetical protein
MKDGQQLRNDAQDSFYTNRRATVIRKNDDR